MEKIEVDKHDDGVMVTLQDGEHGVKFYLSKGNALMLALKLRVATEEREK